MVANMNTLRENCNTARLFYNGFIRTMDDTDPNASVLAVRDGRIVYAGNDFSVGAACAGGGAERVDLQGFAVVPGLTDSHQHFIMEGIRLGEMDIRQKTKDAVLEEVAARAKMLRPGEWIVGRGWNNEMWATKEWPTKEDLDAVAPENPVALTRLDGHSLWVNSAALRLAGMDKTAADHPGGEILRNEDGELKGILVDTPMFRIRSIIPPFTEDQKREACLRTQEEMFRYGITSVGDAWQSPEDHDFLKRLYASGDLGIRVYGMLNSRNPDDSPYLGPFIPPVTDLFDGRLSLRAFKVVLDGSFGSRSAWLTQDYADRPGHRGSGRYTDEKLYGLMARAVERGFQVCVHAIGDAAVLQAVGVFERLYRDYPENRLRHRIEHFQTASAATVARALAMGIIPAMQTIHAAADKHMAASRLPTPLLAESYPWRQVLDAGGIIANGSDSPMDGANPFHGYHAAISRTAFEGLDGKTVRYSLTRKEALKSYTLWAAVAELAADRKGSLSPGKFADFAVLDRDIITCPEDDTRKTRVLMTVLAGETVYGGNL